MARIIEVEQDGFEKTRKFIDKNWKTALAIAGAAGAIGAAVWLTARYLREKKSREIIYDEALRLVEDEVEAGEDQAEVVLETGTYLGVIAGEEGQDAMTELSNQMKDGEGKEALEILRSVIDVNKKK